LPDPNPEFAAVETPTVSVLLPVFNGRDCIADAVRSVLAQRGVSLELLVVDDGSADGSIEVLKSFSDARLHILRQERNQGVASSLNWALREARGAYVARMDADDRCHPFRLQRQIAFLERHPAVSICGSAVRCFGERRGIWRFPRNHETIVARSLFNVPFAHPSVCWRRQDLMHKGLFYVEQPPTAEDYDLWVRLIGAGLRGHNLTQALLDYRIDPQIKISNYLRQQREGAVRIRNSLLDELGLDAEPATRNLFHLAAAGDWSQVRWNDLNALHAFHFQILGQIPSVRRYDALALRRELRAQRYAAVMGLARSFPGLSELMGAAISGPLPALSPRQYLRCLLFRLVKGGQT
jgi:glycosyltransferase involved in cell wall biosynthesis